jgi:tRNA pseudouridine55 synthase
VSRRRRGAEGPDGIAIVNKPAGWTSHDVVAKSRGILGTRKVGHAGTLDPDVTGVLVLGVGRATRLLRYVTGLGKRYEGSFALGVETTTLDASGEVIATHDMADVTVDDVRRVAAERFTGPILQIPPMVSAVKVDGRRLHELARQGIEVARDPRPVTVYSLEIDPLPRTDDGTPRFAMSVHCSTGTYIRTLVADLATALGGGGHLESLERTAVGSFGIEEAVGLGDLDPLELLDVAEAVRDLERVDVDGSLSERITHGARLDRDELGVEPTATGPWAVHGADGTLLAVYEDHGPGRVKPAVVVAQPTRGRHE